MTATRVTVCLTHPVQYLAPWFRYIAARRPEIDLTVLYAHEPTADQQGTGFGTAFRWDVDLLAGYRSRVLRAAAPGADVSDDSLFGADAPEMEQALRDSQPDVALLPGWHSASYLRAYRACRRLGVPLLYRGDSHLGTAPAGWRRRLWEPRTRLLLRRFDGWLSVGARARAYLQHFGVDEPLVFDSPHAVDNDALAAAAAPWMAGQARAEARRALGVPADAWVVGFVGKLSDRKRPLDAVRAVARMAPGASLLVAGTGPLEEACRREAAERGVHVALAGFVNQSTIATVYAAIDCLVLPSERESWGLVVNEAMAVGRPCVVAATVGCAPDLVVAGVTGEVAPGGDVDGLAAALERVRRRGPADGTPVPACRERVARYSFAAASDGVLGAAGRLVRRRGATVAAGCPRVVACCGSMVIVSGVERMSFEVLRVLRERGAAVHCIVNTWESARIVGLAEAIGASWSTGYYWHPMRRFLPGPGAYLKLAWDVACTSAGLLRDARRAHATHVFVPDFTTALRNAPALALLRAGGVRVVLRLGSAPEEGPFYRRLWRRVIPPLADVIVCNSEFTRGALLAHGVPAAKALVVHNTVPHRAGPPPAGIDRDPGRIIYVGQIIPAKGVDLLLDAAGLLVQRGVDARVDVVGDIDGWEPPEYAGYRAGLRARAAAADLAGRVRFLGHREDVPALLAAAAVHCCPSRPEQREAFGVVNVEAKRAGIPSVVTPTGALPEIVEHRVDGWVAAAPTAEALADGLRHFLADPPRRAEAGLRAAESEARFSRDRFASRWLQVFDVAC